MDSSAAPCEASPTPLATDLRTGASAQATVRTDDRCERVATVRRPPRSTAPSVTDQPRRPSRAGCSSRRDAATRSALATSLPLVPAEACRLIILLQDFALTVSVLKTPRLVLRPPEDRDVPAIVVGCSDVAVGRYIPVIPVPYSERDARDWLAGANERYRRSRERSLAITLVEDDELVGVVTIRLRLGGSIGYWMGPHTRGRGLMSEAVDAVVQWAGEQYGLRDLFITAHPENVASQRVAEKAGFIRVGTVEHEPPFRDGMRQAFRFEQRS